MYSYSVSASVWMFIPDLSCEAYWSLMLRISLFIYARSLSQREANLDRFTITAFTCYCKSGYGGCLLMCSQGSPVMDDIAYRFVAQTQRCSFHRLHPQSRESSRRQRGRPVITNKQRNRNVTHQVLYGQSASDMWRIMDRAAAAAAPASPLPSPAPPAPLCLGRAVALYAHIGRAQEVM